MASREESLSIITGDPKKWPQSPKLPLKKVQADQIGSSWPEFGHLHADRLRRVRFDTWEVLNDDGSVREKFASAREVINAGWVVD